MYLSKRKLEQLGMPLGDMSGIVGGRRMMFGGGGDAGRGMDDVIKAQNVKINDLTQAAQEKMLALGQAQIDESKRQYDQNYALSKTVADKQIDVMNQSMKQGQDYYDYMVSQQRPVEQALQQKALTDTSATDAAIRDAILAKATEAAGNTATRASQMRSDIDAMVAEAVSKIGTEADNFTNSTVANSNALRDKANEFYGQQQSDIDAYKQGNQGIQERYAADINADVGNAVADVRAGQAQATNSAIRQALRYGVSLPAATTNLSATQAQAVASAANAARTASTDKHRTLIADGINMRQNAFGTAANATASANSTEASARSGALSAKTGAITTGLGMRANAVDNYTNMANLSDSQKVAALATNRDQRIQDDARDWGKKLDVAGLYRNLPGASQGAYSVANNSGNSAVSNTIAPSTTYNQGSAAGAQTVGSGYQVALNGLGGALNSQTSTYNQSINAAAAEKAGMYSAVGSMVGSGVGAAVAL